MSKGPQWMPLHVADYLRDTSHLSVVEHGAYLLLIMRYWQDGGLPADENLISRFAHLSAEQWIESRTVLAALFDEGWKHKRIDAELAKASDIIDKRRSAAEQKHTRSNAHAEQMESTSSYAGVPPSPSPLKSLPPAPLPDQGARDFDEVWEAFPRNPTSSRRKAEAAWRATKAEDRPAILAAARARAAWFAEDCKARKRTVDAGLKYEPHLSKWIEDGSWRTFAERAAAVTAPLPELEYVDRLSDERLFDECAKLKPGGRVPDVQRWGFPKDLVAKARTHILPTPTTALRQHEHEPEDSPNA